MKIKYFFMISLLALISFSTLTSNTFAVIEGPIDTAENEMSKSPTVTVKKLSGGGEARTLDMGNNKTLTNVYDVSGKSLGTYESQVNSNGTILHTLNMKGGVPGASVLQEANGTFVTGSDAAGMALLGSVAAGTTQNETITSEMVPGGNCVCISGTTPGSAGVSCTGPVAERKYKCTTGSGVSGFEELFRNIVSYIVKIVLLLSVLAVAGIGIAWTFAGGDDIKLKTTIKGWAMNVVAGIIILFLFGLILSFLAPWVYQF